MKHREKVMGRDAGIRWSSTSQGISEVQNLGERSGTKPSLTALEGTSPANALI